MKKFLKSRIIQAALVTVAVPLIIGVLSLLHEQETTQEISTASNSGINNGIIAGKLEINPKVDVPNPEFNIETISTNTPTTEGYRSEFILSVDTITHINKLDLHASGESLIKMQVAPPYTSATVFYDINAQKKDDYMFVEIPNPQGEYRIIAITSNQEGIEFDLYPSL